MSETQPVPGSDRMLYHGVDWVSAVLTPTPELPLTTEDVVLTLSLALGSSGADWIALPQGVLGFESGYLGPGGARVYYERKDSERRSDVYFVLPGQACQMAGETRLKALLRFALGHGHVTRIDSFIDDYERRVAIATVEQACADGQTVTRARRFHLWQDKEIGTGRILSETLYIGTSKSRQQLRVYDKNLESGGEKDCIRWELEARNEAAQTFAEALAGPDADWGKVIASRLVTFVDFRNVDSHSEVEKRSRLGWFRQLVGDAQRSNAYPPAPQRTIEQVAAWLRQAVSPSIALLLEASGGDIGVFEELARLGRTKWRPKHKAMLSNNQHV